MTLKTMSTTESTKNTKGRLGRKKTSVIEKTKSSTKSILRTVESRVARDEGEMGDEIGAGRRKGGQAELELMGGTAETEESSEVLIGSPGIKRNRTTMLDTIKKCKELSRLSTELG